MPTITDWLMVVITAIYVVATVFISYANIKSANATREQLAESKRQYEDKKRLEIMPYIQFEQTEDRKNSVSHKLNLVLDSCGNLNGTYFLSMRMKNIGNSTAKDITYTYQWDNGAKSCDRGPFPIQALSSDESQTISVSFAHSTDNRENLDACFLDACILLRYKDLLENAYTQKLKLKFTRSNCTTLKLVVFTISAPAFMPKEETNV